MRNGIPESGRAMALITAAFFTAIITVSSVYAQIPPVTELPNIFGMEVGNKWTYEGTRNGKPYEVVREALERGKFDNGMTNCCIRIKENGVGDAEEYYEITEDKVKFWGTKPSGKYQPPFVLFKPLVFAWFPMSVGDHRYSAAKGEFDGWTGIYFNMSVTADVLGHGPVTLEFGTLNAYKVRYVLRMWGQGEDQREIFTWWIVPYLGAVKQQDSVSKVKLISFSIGGGSITQETDTDGDGLKDFQELSTYNTDRENSDTDGDGLTDGDEVYTYGTDPTKQDTDRDGLTDTEELSLGTDPTRSDSDNDVMPDKWEIDHGLDPLIGEAYGDKDDDGYSNLREYLSGSDPGSADSIPRQPLTKNMSGLHLLLEDE